MTTAVRTEYDSLYFGGEWLPADSGDRVEVVSPHSSAVIGAIPCAINWFASDLWSPFGGYQQRGIGCEYGPVGLEGDLEYKSIYGAP